MTVFQAFKVELMRLAVNVMTMAARVRARAQVTDAEETTQPQCDDDFSTIFKTSWLQTFKRLSQKILWCYEKLHARYMI